MLFILKKPPFPDARREREREGSILPAVVGTEYGDGSQVVEQVFWFYLYICWTRAILRFESDLVSTKLGIQSIATHYLYMEHSKMPRPTKRRPQIPTT